jgi:hypothetical protein
MFLKLLTYFVKLSFWNHAPLPAIRNAQNYLQFNVMPDHKIKMVFASVNFGELNGNLIILF